MGCGEAGQQGFHLGHGILMSFLPLSPSQCEFPGEGGQEVGECLGGCLSRAAWQQECGLAPGVHFSGCWGIRWEFMARGELGMLGPCGCIPVSRAVLHLALRMGCLLQEPACRRAQRWCMLIQRVSMERSINNQARISEARRPSQNPTGVQGPCCQLHRVARLPPD